ncbi:alpha/beta fold hydrolase [Pseudoruegeria sp. HB172150]|uniref:alpha/beta fold hydrolase n=1 Tax=Pseudoruegeria sp. HB172150 TaxID=2721164 RepID=UPI0015517CE7|nr:alpha/beta hydrolase [Pseudoruegeria sp. HB172150]
MTLTRRDFASGALLAATALAATRAAAQASPTTGYKTVNGVDYYYEIVGEGEPLLLLHGGLGAADMFGPNTALLGEDRQLILVDLYGHGHTALTERPVGYETMGDDMAGLLDALGYDTVDVLGYSMGGGIAFQLAAQHLDKVRRMALVSTGFSRDGCYADILAMQAMVGADMAGAMQGTPMHATYMARAPKPEDFPRLLDEMGTLMKTGYDWSDEAKALPMPVMLVYGDSDMFRPEHEIAFFQLLGGGLKDGGWQRESVTQNRLAILPGRTHYEMGVAPELPGTVLPFLNGTEPKAVWTAN